MVDEIYDKQKLMMKVGLELASLLREVIPKSDFQHLHELFSANEYGEALYFIDWMIENQKPNFSDDIKIKITEVKYVNSEIHKLFEERERCR